MRASTRRGLLGGVAVLATIPAGLTTAQPHPDAELLRLGVMLTEAWAAENEAWALGEGEMDDDAPNTARAFSLTDVTSAVVTGIENTRALTLDGLLVKMQAITWCRDGDLIGVDDLAQGGSPATETRLLAGLLADLSSMWKGISAA